jgi:hypothetical protein
MDSIEKTDTSLNTFADRAFLRIEVLAYMVLGLMLALAALLGILGAGASLWGNLLNHDAIDSIVVPLDRLLFVLMIVEILHTVRVSFRSGTLVCEPFLIVGLIASIRRVLVITLESSQANQPGKWTADSQAMLNATMLELGVLGALILIMVISIFILRHSDRIVPRR